MLQDDPERSRLMKEAGIYTGKWDFVTFFVVPGTTLWLVCQEDWLDSNLSVIGNRPGMEVWLYAWGIFVSGYSFFYIRHLFSLGGYGGFRGRLFLCTACILLAVSVLIPYDPEHFPGASVFHVMFSFSYPVLLALSLLSFLKEKIRSDSKTFLPLRRLFAELGAAALVLWYASGFITGLLEAYVTTAFCGYLGLVERILVHDQRSVPENRDDQKVTSSS